MKERTGVFLVRNPLNFIKVDQIVARVIKPGSPSGFVAGYVLHNLQLATVLQIGGDAGGAEAVRADLGPQTCS